MVGHKFADKDSLREYLLAHGVDFIAWGTRGAKHVEDLLKELLENEISLQLIGGKIYRNLGVVKLIVRSPEVPGQHLVCYEQQMADGRKRQRNVLLAEKKKRNETADQAAMRAIREELGSVKGMKLDSVLLRVGTYKNWEEVDVSPSYPTLSTRYELHQYEVRVRGLPKHPFMTVEDAGEGKKKFNFWKWVVDSDDDLRYKGFATGQQLSDVHDEHPINPSKWQSSGVAQNIFADKVEARKYLLSHGVDTAAWGVCDAKRIEDLLEELQQGEASLQLIGGKIYRNLGVVKLIVRSPEVPGQHLVCYEQQMADGRKRQRNVLLAEKKKRNETADQAAMRAIREELGSVKGMKLDSVLLRVGTYKNWEEVDVSPSYPTLSTRYELHQYEVRVRGLPKHPFMTVEDAGEGKKKFNFWKWVVDSDVDLRYKGPSTGDVGFNALLAQRPPLTIGDSRKGFDVAFINSPIGSATYWPAATAFLSPRSVHRWQPNVNEGGGILTPTWQPPQRSHSPTPFPGTTHIALRRFEPRPPTPSQRQPHEQRHDGERHAHATLRSPPRTPVSPPALRPFSPRTPDGSKSSPRSPTSPTDRLFTPTVPRDRRLYAKPGLEDPASDNGDTTPRTAQARARRLAANLNSLYPPVRRAGFMDDDEPEDRES